jgi:predicted alpha/beta-hydrolase family hydrolase
VTRRSTRVLDLDTPLGPARCHVDAAVGPAEQSADPAGSGEVVRPQATLLLGHGAGGGVDAADLDLLSRALPGLGVTVVRFEQPWRTAGRRVAVPPPQLDVGWRAGVEWLLDSAWSSPRLFFGGRSAGARVACRTANEFEVAGVVCLAFPLHLPGRPEKSRLPELLQPRAPRLVLQGSSDSFGGAAELAAALLGSADPGAAVRLVELLGADHSFRVAKGAPFSPAELRALVASEVAGFLAGT